MSILVSQIGNETWVNSYPQFHVGVSQIGLEVWQSVVPFGLVVEKANATDTATASIKSPVRVSQIGNENWLSAAGTIRVTQIGNEAWTNDPSILHVTQIGNEAWTNDQSRIRVTQIGNEVWLSNNLFGITERANATDSEVASVNPFIVEPCNATDTETANVLGKLTIDEEANAQDEILAFISRGLIINGWYNDSKGGIYYYYRTVDGQPGPRPPVTI